MVRHHNEIWDCIGDLVAEAWVHILCESVIRKLILLIQESGWTQWS